MLINKQSWLRALIFFSGSFFALILCEVVLRFYFKMSTNYDIEMWRYASLLKQKTEDNRFHIHRPNQKAWLMKVEVKINSLGFRDREFSLPKPENVFRILALGDSVTFGWGVSVDKTFTKLIEERINEDQNFNKLLGKTEFINMGVGNYNTEQEAESYLKVGRLLQPDAAIIFFYINDAEPTQTKTPNFLTNHSFLAVFFLQRMEQLRSYFEFDRHYITYYQKTFRNNNLLNFQNHIKKLLTDLQNDGVRPIGVIVPEIRALANYPFLDYHKEVSASLREKGVEVVDLLPVFLGKDPKDLMVASDDPHPNEMGHQIIAKAVFDAIKQRKLIP